MVVEVIVQSGDKDVNVRVILLHTLDAFGCAYDAHELDMLDAVLLEEGDRSGGGAAGREHRVDNDNVALLNVGGHLEVVLHGL